MKIKLFLFLIGVLILAQMIMYKQLVDQNDQKWKAAFEEITNDITTRQNEMLTTQLIVQKMTKEKGTIPDTILEGVADPEKKFLEFMDYLDNSQLGSMEGAYKFSPEPIIKYKPVPLQQTDFTIQFTFLDAKRLESVFGYLLEQQRDYPLKINRLVIRRVPGNKPKVTLDVSLLLPAKIVGAEDKNNTGSASSGS